MEDDRSPRIIAVYGFLGSGKTTVVLHLARELVSAGGRAAVVVNEAGQVPLDGKVLLAGGLPVREIFSGCVCCTLAGDFIETLKELIKLQDLNYILIEPSGLADAPRLFEALEKHVRLPTARALILDAPRLSLLLRAARPLITAQVRLADVTIVNKMDALSRSQAEELNLILADLSLRGPVHRLSARAGLPRELIRAMLQ
ncbi:MAG: GTP-binding protein [Thermodesulfobacteriota bacterium]